MKGLAVIMFVVSLATTGAFAALEGTDNAADPTYSDGWTTGDNGGTLGTFLPWDLTNNNNDGMTAFAGYFIGNSTAGSGDINTAGVSFAIYANPIDAFANASRSFAAPLTLGQTFSLDLAVNFRNGNKGFSLESAAGQIFNLNVGGDDYQINGVSIGADFSSTAIFDLAFTQTSLAGGSYSVVFGANTYHGSYDGIATGLNLYNSDTDNGDAANNLYFNNLAIVPEPSSLILLSGPALLGVLFFARRRRKA
ncbi:MAG TPA: PEP-CTERM sorting domain-containing protein [Chthoniobacterales bacterium]